MAVGGRVGKSMGMGMGRGRGRGMDKLEGGEGERGAECVSEGAGSRPTCNFPTHPQHILHLLGRGEVREGHCHTFRTWIGHRR